MNYAVEMGSGAMIYIANFIKIGSGIHNYWGGGGLHRYTDSMVISWAYFFFQNKESQLIIFVYSQNHTELIGLNTIRGQNGCFFNMRYLVLTVVSIKIVVFWDVTPYGSVSTYQTTWHHVPEHCNMRKLWKVTIGEMFYRCDLEGWILWTNESENYPVQCEVNLTFLTVSFEWKWE
jgi:hypothetical protein